METSVNIPNSTEIEEFYQRLIKEAPYIAGDDGEPVNGSNIPWVNPQLIKEGQDFIRRNNFSVILAHMGALLYGFSFKSLTTVLLRTGGYGLGDTKKTLLRNLETGYHILQWYEQDILAPDTGAYKDIQLVRKMHTAALRKSEKTPLQLCNDSDVHNAEEKRKLIAALKADLDECVDIDTSDSPTELFTYNPQVFFSQYDMVMTQFGFISIIYLFPSTLGIKDTKGLEGFIHLWAVAGRMLGIQDRFNLGLYPIRELYMKLFHKLGVASLKDMDLTMLRLQETYIDATSTQFFVRTMTLKSALYLGLKKKEALPTYKGTHLKALMGWKDFFYFRLMTIIIFLVYHVGFIRRFANWFIESSGKHLERKFLNKPVRTTKTKDKLSKTGKAEINKRA